MGNALRFYRSIPNINKDMKFLDESKISMSEGDMKHAASVSGKFKLEISLNLGIFKLVSGGSDIKQEQKGVFHKIDDLIRRMEKTNSISVGRPKDAEDAYNGSPFAIERTVARKVIFHPNTLEAVPRLKSFAVWISDPPNQEKIIESRKANPWRYDNSFLYLIEAVWDNGEPYQSVFSGTSALKFIVNIRKNHNNIVPEDDGEKYGRWSNLHPIEKIKGLGITIGDPQKIETLYRKRYITDEQTYRYKSEDIRVCDLVGYPFYIASI